MTREARARRAIRERGRAGYLAALLVGAILVGTIYHVSVTTLAVTTCGPSPPPGKFFALCGAQGFGDYEHGVYALGLEPQAITALKRADVLILGNSKTPFAFSTDATHAFFAREHLRYYDIGFGFGESSAFEQSLIDRYGLKPTSVIVNADPFFWSVVSPPAALASYFSPTGLIYFGSRKLATLLQEWVCRRLVDCYKRAGFIYRDMETGDWDWKDHLDDPLHGAPLSPDKMEPFGPPDLREHIRLAEALRASLGLPARCIILTGIPGDFFGTRLYPPLLASAAGFTLVMAKVDGLKTLDGVHLNGDSGERWSKAFFEQAGSTIEECAGKAAPVQSAKRP